MMSRHKRIALRVSGFVVDYLLALPIGCVAALVWANTFPESYYRFAHAIAFAVNDVGIVFFFALITKEVAEATLPGGALHPVAPCRAARRRRPRRRGRVDCVLSRVYPQCRRAHARGRVGGGLCH